MTVFRRMTGVEKGRPEVVLEYSEDLNGPWKEYQFLAKPGNMSAAPLFVAPHQPRLDWQMWFASLGTYHDNPWLVSLTYRLLQGKRFWFMILCQHETQPTKLAIIAFVYTYSGEPSVIKLLDSSKAPKTPPKFIRASLYHYTFTKPSR